MEAIGFFGKLGISGVMVLIWGIIYRLWPIESDRIKTIYVVLSGFVIGFLFMLYNGIGISVQNILDHSFYGLQQGVEAVGLFKLAQAVGVYSYSKEEENEKK